VSGDQPVDPVSTWRSALNKTDLSVGPTASTAVVPEPAAPGPDALGQLEMALHAVKRAHDDLDVALKAAHERLTLLAAGSWPNGDKEAACLVGALRSAEMVPGDRFLGSYVEDALMACEDEWEMISVERLVDEANKVLFDAEVHHDRRRLYEQWVGGSMPEAMDPSDADPVSAAIEVLEIDGCDLFVADEFGDSVVFARSGVFHDGDE
jgi:hypothetical protein